jgi:aspartate kinase
MSIIVQKFGGTSLADTAKISNAASKAVREAKAGHNVIVTVSAMAGETDRLLGLANEIDPAGSPRERDVLASAGEQCSIALMSMAIEKVGVPAISFTGPQIDMRTDSGFTKAKIRSIDDSKIKQAHEEGKS